MIGFGAQEVNIKDYQKKENFFLFPLNGDATNYVVPNEKVIEVYQESLSKIKFGNQKA